MTERQQEEWELLRTRYPGATIDESAGVWILLPQFKIPGDWEHKQYDICFQLNPAYPDTKPYAFYARPLPRSGAEKKPPSDYQDNGEPKPPFNGEWGKFSWDMPEWNSAPGVHSGSNLLNWAESFRGRFSGGL